MFEELLIMANSRNTRGTIMTWSLFYIENQYSLYLPDIGDFKGSAY